MTARPLRKLGFGMPGEYYSLFCCAEAPRRKRAYGGQPLRAFLRNNQGVKQRSDPRAVRISLYLPGGGVAGAAGVAVAGAGAAGAVSVCGAAAGAGAAGAGAEGWPLENPRI
jgi:hypothetical protein